MIDVADYVYHGPSKETWIVAAVNGDRIYWCGYPFGGSAKLLDCTLIKKATDDERNKLLKELSKENGNEIPIIMAKQRLQLIENKDIL